MEKYAPETGQGQSSKNSLDSSENTKKDDPRWNALTSKTAKALALIGALSGGPLIDGVEDVQAKDTTQTTEQEKEAIDFENMLTLFQNSPHTEIRRVEQHFENLKQLHATDEQKTYAAKTLLLELAATAPEENTFYDIFFEKTDFLERFVEKNIIIYGATTAIKQAVHFGDVDFFFAHFQYITKYLYDEIPHIVTAYSAKSLWEFKDAFEEFRKKNVVETQHLEESISLLEKTITETETRVKEDFLRNIMKDPSLFFTSPTLSRLEQGERESVAWIAEAAFFEYPQYLGKATDFLQYDTIEREAIRDQIVKMVEHTPEVFLRELRELSIQRSEEIEAEFTLNFDDLRTLATEVSNDHYQGQSLPNKIIQESDFPIDEIKFSRYFVAIDRMARETTTYNDSRGVEKEGWNIITIPEQSFRDIFYSQSFQNIIKERAGTMSYMNAISLAQATFRTLSSVHGEVTDKNIDAVGRHLTKTIDNVSSREIIGPNVTLILCTHEEPAFDNKKMLDIFYGMGLKPENVVSVKGVYVTDEKNQQRKAKDICLKAIQESSGAVTVVFSGHGAPDYFALSEAVDPDNLQSWNENIDTKITSEDLSQAVAQSQNARNVNVLNFSCSSYNMLSQAFSKGGKEDIPGFAFSAANMNRLAWYNEGNKFVSDLFLDKILHMRDESKTENTPLTVRDFIHAEGEMAYRQDPAFFIHPDFQGEYNINKTLLERGDSEENPENEVLQRVLERDKLLEFGSGVKEKEFENQEVVA